MKSQMDALEKKEEEDIARAIQLSLKEAGSTSSSAAASSSKSKTSNGNSSLFGSLMQSTQATAKSYGTESNKGDKRKVKALYDFEAVEDNEITFKAGDVLYVIDDSDPNWWKGVNMANNEEGLFPSNFVTFDLDTQVVDEINITKKVKFNEKVDVNSYDHRNYKLTIDEKKIDDCIEMLQNADPTGEIQPDTQDMLELEDQCYMMGPLIDTKLQKIDQKHTVLENLNLKILEGFQVYTNLVKESINKSSNFMYNPVSSGAGTSMNPGMMPPAGNPYLNSIPYAAAPPPSLDSNPAFLANQLNSLATNGTYNLPNSAPTVFPIDPSQQQHHIQMAPPAYHSLPGGAAPNSDQMQQQLGYHVGAPTYQS